MKYTKGICLVFGLCVMSSLHLNLRASGKLCLIFSGLYPLSFSVNLNLSRDASRLSGTNFVQILGTHGSIYESVEY